MSTAQHYKSNLRDIFFNLFEVLEIQRTSLGHGAFAGFDEAAARDALTQFERFAQAELAPSFVEGDRTPLTLDKAGNVTLPPGVRDAVLAYHKADWAKLDLPEHLGGYGAPPSVIWSKFELMAGAHAAGTLILEAE